MSNIDTQAAYEYDTPWMIQLEEAGRWHTVDLTNDEALQVLKSGKLDDREIASIAMLNVPTETGSIVYVYDFILMRKGIPAWRLVYEPTV